MGNLPKFGVGDFGFKQHFLYKQGIKHVLSMSVLFFRLRGVPADEAEDVRQLLMAHGVEFYETPGSNWGVSMPAIWLYEEDDLEKIQPFFDEYQEQRAISQRALYQQNKRLRQAAAGPLDICISIFRRLFYSGLIVLTLYVSLKWLFELGL
jgi:hypothetical protein